jgi:ribosomal protein L40E
MTTQIQGMLRQLHIITQSVETTLRQNKSGYEMQRQVCMNCGRTPPMEARKCHPCNNPTLYQRYCTFESRVAEYFAILAKEELWPSVTPFEICSLSDLVLRLTCAKNDVKHSCVAGSRCPLNSELGQLCDRVCRFETGVIGLCLRCVKRGEWNESQTCTCT